MRSALGWLSVLANLGYTVFGYYGFAPPPGGMPTDWWHGRTYILDFESMGGYVDAPFTGAILFLLPTAVLCLTTLLTSNSAVTRMLAVSLTLISGLFALAGFGAGGQWEVFDWRFTGVLVLSGLSLAAAATAPLLVRSWMRLSLAMRFIVYFPIFFCAMAAVRGATGTSEHTMFMMSPWPMFTTMGLDNFVIVVAGFLLSVAAGVLLLARAKFDALSVVGIAAAVYLPSLLVERAWSTVGMPEFAIGIVVPSVLITASLIAACSMNRLSGDRRETLLNRGFHLGLAATLVFVPVFSGHALAAGDYSVNRFVRAPMVIDALQRHIKQEEFYPETLDELVEAGYLKGSTKPRIGFDILEHLGLADEVNYRYSEYGSSFILEFDSTFWVQCAYSGNYYFDDEEELDEEEREDAELAEDLPEWTCLHKSPALFNRYDEPEYDDEYYDDEEDEDEDEDDY
jgi:hypothetical protein